MKALIQSNGHLSQSWKLSLKYEAHMQNANPCFIILFLYMYILNLHRLWMEIKFGSEITSTELTQKNVHRWPISAPNKNLSS
jgi:hypothetical protein